MSRHGILQILSKGILPVVCLVIALAACNNCSPKVAPERVKAENNAAADRVEMTKAENYSYGRYVERAPEGQTYGGNDGDLGNSPDVGPNSKRSPQCRLRVLFANNKNKRRKRYAMAES